MLKRFPGHGHGSGDSHTGTVRTPPLSELMTSDLVPWRTLARMPGVAAMVGHLIVPGLTGDELPASVNPRRSRCCAPAAATTDRHSTA